MHDINTTHTINVENLIDWKKFEENINAYIFIYVLIIILYLR